jgi:hypothetical protein
MVLFVVLGLMIFCVFVFFALQKQAIQMRHSNIRLLDEEYSLKVAQGAAGVFWMFLEDVFRERRGCNRLYPISSLQDSLLNITPNGQMNDFSLLINDLDKKDELKALFRVIEGKFPSIGLKDEDCEVRFSKMRESDCVVFGQAEMKIRVLHKTRPYDFTFTRYFRLLNFLPPIPSKFTLFVKECPSPEYYNIVKKAYQEDFGDKKTLTLFNRKEPVSPADTNDVWKKSGWVFLGGNVGGPINLNIDGTAPTREGSENFIFWPRINQPPSQLGLTHACSSPLGGTSFRVRLTPTGCTKEWGTDGVLKRAISDPLASELLAESSVLRLFGKRTHMSPTKVFGNVHSRYVLYSSLIYDPDNDSEPNMARETASYTLQRLIFPIVRKTATTIANYNPDHLIFFTPSWYSLSVNFNGVPGFPPSIGDIIPTALDYLSIMTRLSTDAPPAFSSFNGMYDLFFDGVETAANKSFPPPDSRRCFQVPTTFSSGDYPNTGGNFTLESGVFGPIFDTPADLKEQELDPMKNYKDGGFPVSYFLSTQEELWEKGIFKRENNRLVIDSPCTVFINGDLDLADFELLVAAPAILAVKGNVTLEKVVRRSSTVTGQPSPGQLVVYSQTGNIKLTAPKVAAQLVAPAGTVTWTEPLDLHGTLFCKNLNPNEIGVHGGRITYEPDYDPTIPANWCRGFSMVLSPRSSEFVRREFP